MRKEFHPTHAQAGMAGRDRSRLVAEARAKASLIVHQRIAERLLSASNDEAQAMCERARAELERRRLEVSCPVENINFWVEILNLPIAEIAKAIVSDMDGRGTAMRENSPWKRSIS